MALNARQRRFVLEFLKDGNATQAAVRAGYSAATAKQQGSRLLTVADVRDAVAEGQQRVESKIGLSVEECYGVLADVAVTAEAPRDRVQAATALLKLQHKVAEKVEHSGTVSLEVLVTAAGKPEASS